MKKDRRVVIEDGVRINAEVMEQVIAFLREKCGNEVSNLWCVETPYTYALFTTRESAIAHLKVNTRHNIKPEDWFLIEDLPLHTRELNWLPVPYCWPTYYHVAVQLGFKVSL